MFDFDVLKISEAGEAEEARLAVGPLGLAAVRLDVPVTEIPRGPALTLSPEAGVATAIEAMRQRGRGAAVVVQNHRPLGVVTDRDILGQTCAETDDLRSIPIASLMLADVEPLREGDSVGEALRSMCARRQWHLPIVCNRGLFLGALDIADISLWLRDRLTVLSVDAALGDAGVGL
jgi:CBS domain-containing protein